MSLSKEVHNLMDDVYQSLMTCEEVFITNSEWNECEDINYELPRVALVDKYGYYNEYAIVSIDKGIFKAYGISEGCDGKEFSDLINVLSYNEAVNLLGWLDN